MSAAASEGGALAAALSGRGYLVVRDLVPAGLLAPLAEATDRALAEEAEDFPPGDDQHGRLLFAPAHGGAFLDLCAVDPLFRPMEQVVGSDAIIYTMTTSVLAAGSDGPAGAYHVDLACDRPAGVALTALLMLDRFDAASGAMEVLVGSQGRPLPAEGDAELVTGSPGDVCFFDPRLWHRSTTNRSDAARRAVLVQVVAPWMKQRVDVRAMLAGTDVATRPPVVRRRLGLDALAPRDRQEFLARRDRRPWT